MECEKRSNFQQRDLTSNPSATIKGRPEIASNNALLFPSIAAERLSDLDSPPIPMRRRMAAHSMKPPIAFIAYKAVIVPRITRFFEDFPIAIDTTRVGYKVAMFDQRIVVLHMYIVPT